jgi:transcriptional regulator GlxA family with amidase domain
VDARVKTLLELLATSPRSPLGLREAASVVGLTSSRLSSLFRKETGRSLATCLHTARLNQAARLLLLSTLSVKEIAHAVDFRSASHFVRAFKHAFGTTPRQYRLKGDEP